MTLSEELTWRGFVNQTTLDDIKKLDSTDITFYHGFDASADSQTIGNLAAMMFDMVFMRHGAKAILLAGGATSLIGDPGGKDSERPLQSEDVIRHNVNQAEKQLNAVFQGQPYTLVNNLEWFKDMPVLEFLRDIGKHFGMSTLIQRDYIQQRIGEGGSGMSYTEFSYTLMQGYDFLYLYRKYGCNLQLAGSDQWGNSLSGVDLVRKVEGREVHVMTLPLIINKATGKKFGKSEDGAVWLDSSKTSVYKFYQFWLNADDAGVVDYLKIYTLLDKDDIDELEKKLRENPGGREAQKALAREVTALVHGKDRARAVEDVTSVLFGGTPVSDLSQNALDELAREIPVSGGGNLIDILVQSGLVGSGSEARRLLESAAISLNGEKVTEDVNVRGVNLVKKGKNGFLLVR
jgi:tyrosyl-tRNA synthetase